MVKAVLLALALAPGAMGFGAPLAARQRLFGVRGAVQTSRPTASSPLGVFGRKEEATGPSAEEVARELAKHYRTLGVRAEANFEEIADQTERLRLKYKGDIKKVKMVEIAKDRIMELKLAQRMSGSLAVASGAAQYDAERDIYAKAKGKKKAPAWMRYIRRMWCPPTAQERTRFAAYYGCGAGASILVPHMHGALQGLTLLLSISMLYSKRAGLQFSNPGEAYSAQMPEIQYKIVGIAALVCIGGWCLGHGIMNAFVALFGPVVTPGTPAYGA